MMDHFNNRNGSNDLCTAFDCCVHVCNAPSDAVDFKYLVHRFYLTWWPAAAASASSAWPSTAAATTMAARWSTIDQLQSKSSSWFVHCTLLLFFRTFIFKNIYLNNFNWTVAAATATMTSTAMTSSASSMATFNRNDTFCITWLILEICLQYFALCFCFAPLCNGFTLQWQRNGAESTHLNIDSNAKHKY